MLLRASATESSSAATDELHINREGDPTTLQKELLSSCTIAAHHCLSNYGVGTEELLNCSGEVPQQLLSSSAATVE